MKYFGLGLLTGAVLGAVVGFVKNPQTGKTIKHDFKQQIDETLADTSNLKDAEDRFDKSMDYLKNDGAKLINNTLNAINDRLDGFNQQIEPNLKAIDEQMSELQNILPETEPTD